MKSRATKTWAKDRQTCHDEKEILVAHRRPRHRIRKIKFENAKRPSETEAAF
jgi:hypothetical protein